jgi:hypothetical protein
MQTIHLSQTEQIALNHRHPLNVYLQNPLNFAGDCFRVLA